MSDGHVDPTRQQLAAFAALDREGPVHMLNLVRLRDQAVYPDGRKATGAEAYRAYAHDAAAVFARVGARQHYVAGFEVTLIGPAEERWDLVFIAEYPNAQAFLEMVADPEYREALKHRQAAVDDSRLVRLRLTRAVRS